MKIVVYSSPEAAPSERFLAVPYHANGDRCPVIFFATAGDAARHNAEAWYEGQLAEARRKAAPRKAPARKAEAPAFDDDGAI